MPLCKFTKVGNEMICEHGVLRMPIVDPALPPKKYRGNCGQGANKPALTEAQLEAHGLGTLVENALTAVGVTPESWTDFKKKMGLPATCNCQLRKDYLNKLSAELGEKAKNAVSKLLGFG